MKVTATRDVYTYDELTPDAQQRALEKLTTDAWESFDSDMVAEDLAGWFVGMATGNHDGAISCKELADKYGVRITWQVAYVQSDHAAIEGKLHRSDLPNLAWPEDVTYARVTTTNFGHSRVECVETENGTDYHSDKCEMVYDMIRRLNGQLYRQVRDLCEHYTEAEYVLDMYENCYGLQRRFTIDGDYAPAAFWCDDTEGDK